MTAHTKVSEKKSRDHRQDNTYVIRSFLSFSFFRPPNAILVPGMYFFGFSRYSNYATTLSVSTVKDGNMVLKLTRVSSDQTIPFWMLASVYWKPVTVPDLRPNRPKRFGPILWGPFSSRVWHWAQRVLNKPAPLESEPCWEGGGMLVIRSTYPHRINKHTFRETHCIKVDYVVVEERCAEV